MNTPETPSERLAIMHREKAEHDGFVFAEDTFNPADQATIEFHLKKLGEQNYRIILDGRNLRIGFRGISKITIVNTIAQICLVIGSADHNSVSERKAHQALGDISAIGAATHEIIEQVKRIRSGNTGHYKLPDEFRKKKP